MNAFKDVGAGVRNIFGGRAKSYENELASGVSDALAEMEQQAAQLGADAVVGVTSTTRPWGNNMLMVPSRPRSPVTLMAAGRQAREWPGWSVTYLQGAGVTERAAVCLRWPVAPAPGCAWAGRVHGHG